MNTSQLSIVMMALFFLVNYLPAMLGISNKDLREILRNQVSQFEMQGEIEKAIKCAGDLIELDRNSNDNFNLAKSLELMGDLKRNNNKMMVLGDEICRGTEEKSANIIVAYMLETLVSSKTSFITATPAVSPFKYILSSK